MLRRVLLENFVGFKDKQTIEFKENESPTIFVGENGSGKTSLLEGIRRCLKSSRSTTRSSVYDEQYPSYFVCKFDTSKCSEEVLKAISKECMYTGIVTNNEEYFKFVSTPSKLFIDKYPKVNEKNVSGEFQSTDTENAKTIYDELNRNELNCTRIFDRTFTDDDRLKDDSKVEQLLKLLEDYVVMTFPLRSIGPLQWSKSERIAEQKRQENYSEASRRAEIISYFLENTDEFNLEKEKQYFSGLTGRTDIQFELSTPSDGETRNIVVKSKENKLPGDEFALLKTPEGMLEAKHMSILISSKTFQTLILEEPDRGMHPQMTERMLAIIQSESENKKVVFTTHNPCFVSPTTISSLVIFKRIRPTNVNITNKYRTKVVSDLESIFRADKHKPKQNLSFEPGMKTLRLLTRDHFTHFIFAKRILFCEGDSDFLFLTALKEKIMKQSDGTKKVLQLIQERSLADDLLLLQNMLVSIQIINMGGWRNACRLHSICKELELHECYFVCDKDAMIQDDAEHKITQSNKWLEETAYLDILEKYNHRTISWDDARKRLQTKCKCFAWRDGTIEDMVLSLLRSETQRSCTSGTTEVKWTEKTQVIDELEQQFVTLPPLHRWKDRRPNIRTSRNEDKTDKLFLNKEVKQENITNSVELFLNACEKESDDLVQFVQFLMQIERT